MTGRIGSCDVTEHGRKRKEEGPTPRPQGPQQACCLFPVREFSLRESWVWCADVPLRTEDRVILLEGRVGGCMNMLITRRQAISALSILDANKCTSGRIIAWQRWLIIAFFRVYTALRTTTQRWSSPSESTHSIPDVIIINITLHTVASHKQVKLA